MKTLVALPVFNEAKHVTAVLDEVVRFADNVLVVDDGSTDGTSQLLSERRDVVVTSFAQNRSFPNGTRRQPGHVRRFFIPDQSVRSPRTFVPIRFPSSVVPVGGLNHRRQ